MVYTAFCEVIKVKMQIREFADLTGVSVRTLHYYDEIGLLKPCFTDAKNGYRYYDDSSLLRMQEILFYRELDFSLKSIGEILSSQNYNKEKALMQQKKLLILKKERLEKLISAVNDALKGKNVMTAFDKSEYENYRREVKEKWGSTAAYKEHEAKTAGYNDEQYKTAADGMNGIFAAFAQCRKDGNTADSDASLALVKRLQDYITANFYTCTNEILASLGQMYTEDERFSRNINKNGAGTAAFVSEAIAIYCKK